MTLAAALLIVPPSAASGATFDPPDGAATPWTEEPVAVYRTDFGLEDVCGTRGESGEIIVCGRKDDSGKYRSPLPFPEVPGRYVRGESRGPGAECMRLCYQPVRVNVLKAVPAVVKGIRRIFNPDL